VDNLASKIELHVEKNTKVIGLRPQKKISKKPKIAPDGENEIFKPPNPPETFPLCYRHHRLKFR
jgi:hypothetical protein